MSDNRKYYYLKLKENFYNSETMVILESMQDGLLYSNLLLKNVPHVTQKRRHSHAQRPSAPHAPDHRHLYPPSGGDGGTGLEGVP